MFLEGADTIKTQNTLLAKIPTTTTKLSLIPFVITLIICVLISSAISADENEPDWKLKINKKGVKVFIAKGAIPTVKAVTVVDADKLSLLRLLRDTEIAPDWISQSINVELLSRPIPNIDIVLSIFDSPWPFANRFMVTESVYKLTEYDLTITVKELPKYAIESEHLVRMQSVKGQWYVQGISNRQIKISYIGQGHPGGAIPMWISYNILKQATFQTFLALRQKIIQEKYQNKPLAYD